MKIAEFRFEVSGLIIFTGVLFVSLFSPIISLFMATISLASEIKRQSTIVLICLIISHSIAIIIASQSFGVSDSDDFINYYSIYESLANNASIFQSIEILDTKLEVGLPTLFYVISLASSDLNPAQLKYILAFIFSIFTLATIWHANKNDKTENIAILLALFICLISFSVFSQLVRQGFSSVFLLLSISSRYKLQRVAFLVLATLFHATAPFIFLLLSLLKVRPYLTTLSCLAVLFLLFNNPELMFELDLGSLPKFAYVLRQDFGSPSSIDMGNLKVLLIALFAAVVFILIKRTSALNQDARQSVSYFLFFTFFYCILLPIPLLSTRITMYFSLIFLGYYLGKIAISNKRNYAISLVLILSLLKPMMYFSLDQGGGDYWYNYPAISFRPGYYIEVLMR